MVFPFARKSPASRDFATSSESSLKRALRKKREVKIKHDRLENELLLIILLCAGIASLTLWPVAKLVANYYDQQEQRPLTDLSHEK